MTGSHVGPHWSKEDTWTGFFLLVVPMPGLPVPAEELWRQVTSRVRSDMVLFDLTRVALSPPVDGSPGQYDAIAMAMLAEAGGQGHFFAPRGVFSCVIVGGDAEEIAETRQRLEEHLLLRRLNVIFYTQVVAEVGPAVAAMCRLPERMMLAHEQQPGLAVDEQFYLAELAAAARQSTEPPTADASPSLGSSPIIEVAAPASSNLHPPVVHREGSPELRPPSLWRRARERLGLDRPSLTESDWLEHFATAGNAVAIVYLVFMPDDSPPSKSIANRRKAVAVALDGELGRVRTDPASGRDLTVAVEVLSATRPPTRQRSLRPAGSLGEGDLPSVAVEYPSFLETVDAFVATLEIVNGSLTRRDIHLTSTHAIFLATTAPLPCDESVESFDALLRHAWVTWLHFGPDEMISNEFARPAVHRVHLLNDQPDIVSQVMHYCSVLYEVPMRDD